jgi:uracil-DNA glycosylase family 4
MGKMFIEIEKDINNCTKCELSAFRKHAITGDGVHGADIMLIGEAPGADEDEQGKPFVGRSGKLLMQMLVNIGISRDKNLYITNTLKCRPPENRNPKPSESEACKSYLDRQIELHNPKVIILVGNFACKYFLGKQAAISKIHGTFIEHNGRTLFPVFHPAAILRNPKLKPIAIEDFEKLKEYLK